MLEMGGLDGNTSSQSSIFEKVDWKRIIVEGNPQFRDDLSKLSTAVTVNSAVCESSIIDGKRQEVHFVADSTDLFTSGMHTARVLRCVAVRCQFKNIDMIHILFICIIRH